MKKLPLLDAPPKKYSELPYDRILDSAPKPEPDAIAFTIYAAIIIITSALIGMLTCPS